ncbi:MAG: hypothetical protein GVY07_11005 [Bacteroidetes bacterium]|jgi:hypothetical protein|nr:hypothetical protein [Bacteroidota bacterium]
MNIKSKALLAYIVIFLAGGASGYFLNEAVSPDFPLERFERGPAMNNDFPPPGQEEIPQRIKEFFIDRLELREDQIGPYFAVQSEHMQKVFDVLRKNRRNERDTLRKLHSTFIDDIDEILTSKQIEELNSFAHPDSVQQRRMERQRHRQGRRR